MTAVLSSFGVSGGSPPRETFVFVLKCLLLAHHAAVQEGLSFTRTHCAAQVYSRRPYRTSVALPRPQSEASLHDYGAPNVVSNPRTISTVSLAWRLIGYWPYYWFGYPSCRRLRGGPLGPWFGCTFTSFNFHIAMIALDALAAYLPHKKGFGLPLAMSTLRLVSHWGITISSSISLDNQTTSTLPARWFSTGRFLLP